MTRQCLQIRAELELLSPLHLGSGEVVQLAGPDEAPQPGKPAAFADIVRDHEGLPTVPGASVKGVLRALAGAGATGADSLFGPPTGEALYQGRLTVRRLRCSEPGVSIGMPFSGLTVDGRDPLSRFGLYVAARTAVDPVSGTADDGKLFHQLMAAPGAIFELDLALRLDPDVSADTGGPSHPDAAARAEACLTGVLAVLAGPDGVPFGAGQSLGQGRMRLRTATLRADRQAIDRVTGRLVDPDRAGTAAALRAAIAACTPAAAPRRIERWLACDGPFLVNDSSVAPPKGSALPRLNGQRRGSGQRDDPVLLPGSSLAGALRARAGWLSRLLWADDARGGDARDRILDPDPVARDDPRTVQTAAKLRPAERLFGVAGWRGLLRVAAVEGRGHAGFEPIASVRLDRFSMASIDGSLFKTCAAVDPLFRAVLEVERRGDFPCADDDDLLQALLEDLAEEGLMLGHGTGRGYGWFTVTEDRPAWR